MTEGYLVIPAYNEARGIAAQLERLALFLEQHATAEKIHYTVLVVNDGSSDSTSAEVERVRSALAARGITLELIDFVRNFGHQAAVIAGLRRAAEGADFAITIDADGEQPHALIPALVEAWRQGEPLVHTLRLPHRELSWIKRWASGSYYRLLSLVSGIPIRPGMADFKLWDGGLLREIQQFLPLCGSTRVFATWLAPQAPALAYEQAVIPGRSSRFTLRKNLSLALSGVVRYSDAPLRLSLLMSLVSGLVGIGHSLFVIWAAYTGSVIPGWSTIVIIVAFFGALQSFSIGILGEYLLRISFRGSLPVFVTRARRSERAA